MLLAAAGAGAAWRRSRRSRPAVLLALLFLIGVGRRRERADLADPLARAGAARRIGRRRSRSGSVNQNLARAVGPAIGGVLLAATSAALVFGVNAVSFLAVLGAVAVTAVPVRTLTLPREHVFAAVRAGGRYVGQQSQLLLALIVRAVAFIFPAGALWALLPLVARSPTRTRLSRLRAAARMRRCRRAGRRHASGPRCSRRLAPRVIYALACLAIAGAGRCSRSPTALPSPSSRSSPPARRGSPGLGLLGAAYQGQLPPWVKARGVSYYLVAFQGANGIGALVLGRRRPGQQRRDRADCPRRRVAGRRRSADLASEVPRAKSPARH